jgi:hypothetical protein
MILSYVFVITVREDAYNMLGAGAFYQFTSQICQSILLGQKYVLLAMERAGINQLGYKKCSDGTLLSMDTFHFINTGLMIVASIH